MCASFLYTQVVRRPSGSHSLEAVPKDFHEKFSKVVRNYGVLYDKGCTDFKDKNKKTQAWFQGGNTMGMTKGNMNDLQFFPCEM